MNKDQAFMEWDKALADMHMARQNKDSMAYTEAIKRAEHARSVIMGQDYEETLS